MTRTVLPGQEVIEELCARFILNLPADELQWVSLFATYCVDC